MSVCGIRLERNSNHDMGILYQLLSSYVPGQILQQMQILAENVELEKPGTNSYFSLYSQLQTRKGLAWRMWGNVWDRELPLMQGWWSLNATYVSEGIAFKQDKSTLMFVTRSQDWNLTHRLLTNFHKPSLLLPLMKQHGALEQENFLGILFNTRKNSSLL